MIKQINIDHITVRLAAMGYTYNATADGAILLLLWGEVENEIFHTCNISKVDDCDYSEMESVVAFRLLLMKKKTGTLGSSIPAIVKRVTEGDTTIEYATGNTGADEALTAYLEKGSVINPALIARHRKLVW